MRGGRNDAGAVAGDVDLVDVEDLGEGGGDAAQAKFQLAVALQRGGALDGGRLALDVGEDGGDGGDLAAHLCLQRGDEVVGLAQGHGLVHLQVLFDVQLGMEGVVLLSADLLHADLMDGEVAAGRDGADAVVDALRKRGGGDGVDDDVGPGQVALHGLRGGQGELLGALEGEVARQAERDVGEVVGAGAAGAQAFHREHAGDGREVVQQIGAELVLGLRLVAGGVGGGCGVQQGVDGLVGKPPTDAQDDSGDHQCGDGVGVLQPGAGEALAGVGGPQAEHDGQRGPHVGGEVEGVGGESGGAVLARDAAQRARAAEVHHNRDQQHGEGPERGQQREMAVEDDAADGLVDDPRAGGEHDARLDEGGQRLHLAVAVVVHLVGGTVGDLDGEESDRRGDEVDGRNGPPRRAFPASR